MNKSPNAIDVQVGANLRFLRHRRGMSQEVLAGHLGIAFQQVQKYEKGSNRISASKVVLASRVLGCAIAELFHDVEGSSATEAPTPRTGYQTNRSVRTMQMIDALPPKQRAAVVGLVRTLTASNTSENGGVTELGRND